MALLYQEFFDLQVHYVYEGPHKAKETPIKMKQCSCYTNKASA